MSSNRIFRAFLSTGLAAGSAAVLISSEKNRSILRPLLAQNQDPQGLRFPRSTWIQDWDKREVDSHTSEVDLPDVVPKSQATRHLLLIRHGQYDMKGQVDTERKLTALGQIQALDTGTRLAELKLPYTKIIRSNMTRAMETSDLIAKVKNSLSNLFERTYHTLHYKKH